MKPLRTIIVDDEPLALAFLNSVLDKMPSIEIIGECANGREAIAMTHEYEPDLLFMDIQMPGVNGFQVVEALQSDIMPMVVFVTAYDQYALNAFDLHAVDYVLKPLDPERVDRAVERALDRVEAHREGEFKKPLIGAIHEIAQKINKDSQQGNSTPAYNNELDLKKLVIRDGAAVTLVTFDDIEWIDAAGDYMCVHANGQTHIMRSTLKDLLERLDTQHFKRVHRSTIVNLKQIKEVSPLPKGERLLHLNGGGRLKVSRTYKEAVAGLFINN